MHIDIDVQAVAALAKLHIDEEEIQSVKSELESIVGFARKLEDGVDVTAHIVPMHNVLREDVAENNYDRDELLKNAPTGADGYMTVPKTLE